MALHVRDSATDIAVRRLAKLKGKTLTDTIREAVEREYERARARIPLIETGHGAVAAFERYGKGRHPAALNMGERLAYACALALDLPLRCEGGDLPRTDIPAA